MSVGSSVPSLSASASTAPSAFGDDAGGQRAQVHGHAQRLDAPAQHRAADVVDLQAHQARRELDDVRLEAQVLERVRRLEAEQAAADDHADLERAA